MGRIKNEDLYILDQTVSGNDRLIGSDGDDLKKTKNFSVNDLLTYMQDNSPSQYVLPTATDAILGGVKIDNDTITILDGVITANYEEVPIKQNDSLGSIYWDYFRDDANFGTQGFGSFDLSFSFAASTVYGSTGQYSFTSGYQVTASQYGSVAFGQDNTSSGAFSWASGFNNTNSSYAGFVHGYSNNLTASGYGAVFGIGNDSGTNGGIMAGIALISTGGNGTAILGAANEVVAGVNNGTSTTQPMIVVGNGTHTTPTAEWEAVSRSNLLVGLRNGEVTLPSTTIAVIDGESTGKQIITREWHEAQKHYDVFTEDLTVTSSHDIDWDNDTHNLVLTGDTTFTESNLPPAGFSKTITIYITGSFTPTFPANWETNLQGTYNGAVLNQVVIEYVKNGFYWMTISQAQ